MDPHESARVLDSVGRTAARPTVAQPGIAASSIRDVPAGTFEWCVLGPARTHHTLATGEIIGKEEAGFHALTAFPQHAPITEVALAKVRGARIPSAPSRRQWRGLTASAMDDMITASLD